MPWGYTGTLPVAQTSSRRSAIAVACWSPTRSPTPWASDTSTSPHRAATALDGLPVSRYPSRRGRAPLAPESLSGDTGRIFDALRPVEDAAALTMAEILQPERAARLAQAKAHDPNALTLDDVLGRVVEYTWQAERQQAALGAAQRAVALAVLRSIVQTAELKTASMLVRGACWAVLDRLSDWLRTHPATPDWVDATSFATHLIASTAGSGGVSSATRRHAPVLEPFGRE